jgi:RNA polymerase sigma factor (sigma-70 family)
MKDLIESIKIGGPQRLKAQEEIYRSLRDGGCEQIIFKSIEPYRATMQDAEDLFHEAFIILMNKLQNGEHQVEFSMKSFLVSIARNLWKNKSRMNKLEEENNRALANEPDVLYYCDDYLARKERKEIIAGIIGSLTEKCRTIIKLWMEDFSMREIAERMSLSSERMAIKYKYRCHKKLVSYLSGKPHLVKELNY